MYCGLYLKYFQNVFLVYAFRVFCIISILILFPKQVDSYSCCIFLFSISHSYKSIIVYVECFRYCCSALKCLRVESICLLAVSGYFYIGVHPYTHSYVDNDNGIYSFILQLLCFFFIFFNLLFKINFYMSITYYCQIVMTSFVEI